MTEAERLDRLEAYLAVVSTALMDLSLHDRETHAVFKRMRDELDGLETE